MKPMMCCDVTLTTEVLPPRILPPLLVVDPSAVSLSLFLAINRGHLSGGHGKD